MPDDALPAPLVATASLAATGPDVTVLHPAGSRWLHWTVTASPALLEPPDIGIGAGTTWSWHRAEWVSPQVAQTRVCRLRVRGSAADELAGAVELPPRTCLTAVRAVIGDEVLAVDTDPVTASRTRTT